MDKQDWEVEERPIHLKVERLENEIDKKDARIDELEKKLKIGRFKDQNEFDPMA